MADNNSYALNLEFTLQSNAEEVLSGIAQQLSSVESRVQNVISKIAKSLDDTASGVASATERMTASVQKVSEVNLSSAAKAASKTESLASQEKAILDEVANMREQMSASEMKESQKFQSLKEKWFKVSQAMSKQDISDKDVIEDKRKTEIKDLDKIIDQYLEQEKSGSKIGVIFKKIGSTANKTMRDAGRTAKNVFANINKGLETVLSGVRNIFSSITGFMGTLGFGPLLSLISLTGIYTATIGASAEETERFHTANFRLMGSMRDIHTEITRTAPEFNVLRQEAIEATIALREFGASKTDVADLNIVVAALNRTTGVSIDMAAKFAKTMTVVTGKTARAEKELVIFHRAARELALTGKDLDVVIRGATDSAFLMGSKGQTYASMFNKMLLRAAGGAKQLGLSTEEAVSFVDRMKDPLEVVAALGRKAFTMTPIERMQAMGDMAKVFYDRFTQMGESQAKFALGQEIMARMGIKSYGQIEKQLKLMMQTAKGGEEAFKKGVEDPQKEIANALKESSGLLRKTTLLIDKVITRLMNAFKPWEERIEGFVDYLLKANIDKTIHGWGKVFTEVGIGMLDTIMEVGRVLYNDFIKWFETSRLKVVIDGWKQSFRLFLDRVKEIDAVKLAATLQDWADKGKEVVAVITDFVKQHPWLVKVGLAVTAAAVGFTALSVVLSPFIALGSKVVAVITSMGAALSGATAAAILLGKAALVIGSAFAGWKIGRWIDETFELGSAFDRVANGTATWIDYVKSANIAGMIVIGYKKAREAIDKYNDSQQRQIQLAKKKELAELGLLTPLTAIDKKIQAINAEIRSLGRGDEERIQRLAVQGDALRVRRAALIDQEIQNRAKEAARLSAPNREVEQIEEATAKLEKKQAIEEKLSDSVKKMTKDQSDYIIGVQEAATKSMQIMQDLISTQNQLVTPQTKMLDVDERASDAMTVVPPVAATPITTSKIDDQTARAPERENEVVKEAEKQTVALTDILNKLDNNPLLTNIVNLLNDHLPELADRDTGLASSANQWNR